MQPDLTSQKTSMASEIKDGLRDALPIVLAIAPYSVVFGAFAVDQGLTPAEILLASATIFAVASQYVMVNLMGQDVPIWSILLAVLAVNFRHVLYSAALTKHLRPFAPWQKLAAFFLLVDPQYATCAARGAVRPIRPSYYFSYAAIVYIAWMCSNLIGVLFGGLMGDPSRLGLDLLLPMFFASLVIGFRNRPRFPWVLLASVTTSLVAFFAIGSPWHITLGGFAGILTAAMMSKPTSVSEVSHA